MLYTPHRNIRKLKMLILHHNFKIFPSEAPCWMRGLLKALKEIEGLVGHDSLDIEFAIDQSNKIHIFQMRPIAVDHSNWKVSGALVNTQLKQAERVFNQKQKTAAKQLQFCPFSTKLMQMFSSGSPA